jgi:DDE superfamily endonuclease
MGWSAILSDPSQAAMSSHELSACGCRRFAPTSPDRPGRTCSFWSWAPEGPLIIGVDDTIARRWGARIAARGIYRDPVRSSHGHFVKTSGLRWLSFMVLAPVPRGGARQPLPVLTVLAPSERANAKAGRRHKLLTDLARQGMLQLCRWLPGRRIVFVGDASFAIHTCSRSGGVGNFDQSPSPSGSNPTRPCGSAPGIPSRIGEW